MTKKGRNSNGMGSIRKRADGRWEARYTGPDGKSHSLFARTQKDVSAKLREALNALDTGTWREPTKMTVGEWLTVWLESYCGHVSPGTKDFYEKLCRLYVRPQLGEIRMDRLLSIHVRQMVTTMANRKPEPLAPKTIRSTLGTLKVALGAAVQAKLIRENPAVGVPIPRQAKYEMHIVDRPMIPAFVAAAQETPVPEALELLLMTGLRSGELRGLRWGDIDWTENIIHVRQQIHTVKGGEVEARPPKDDQIRDVHAMPQAMDVLRRQRKRQAGDRLKAGAGWYEDAVVGDLVFRLPNGRQYHDRVLLGAVYKVAKAIGMPGLHTHDLRHSYAVAALRAGVDVKTVQHNLGHASAAMTLDTYAGFTEDAGKAGAQRLGDYWSAANLGQN